MKRAFITTGAIIVIVFGLVAIVRKGFSVKSNQPIDVLRTSLRVIDKFPDPAYINTSGKWYFLNHISSPLIGYDHKNSSFLPLIAKSWDIRGNRYIFTLDESAKFSDGAIIRARDVVASIKRILAKKTSPHFPLWERVVDCANLTDLNGPCAGIKGDDAAGTVEVDLNSASESFLLQISSPEGGIWSADDIDPKTLELRPRRFSGPYILENLEANADREMIFLRNSNSKIQTDFPNSPRKIVVKSMSRVEVEKSIADGSTDIFFGDFIPYNEFDWEAMNVGVHYTTPSSIVYFFKLNTDKKIGQDLLKALSILPDRRLTFAETILPFAPSVALSKDDVVAIVPVKSSRSLVVAAPGFYFKDKFLSFLEASAKSAGIDLKFVKIDMKELEEVLESKENYKSKYDFVLSSYVASERYPAVQLRYLKGKRTSPVDLGGIESPDNDPVKIKKLVEFEKWLLSSQTVVPLYFVRSHMVYAKAFDIGEQPVTDADMQLWRLTRRTQ